MMGTVGGSGVTGSTTSIGIGSSTFTLMGSVGADGVSVTGVSVTCAFTSRLEEMGTGMLSETGLRFDPTDIGRLTEPTGSGRDIEKTGIGRTIPNQCLAGDGLSSIFIATMRLGLVAIRLMMGDGSETIQLIRNVICGVSKTDPVEFAERSV